MQLETLTLALLSLTAAACPAPQDAATAEQEPAEEAAPTHDESKLRKPLPPAEVIAALPADGGPEFNRLVFEQSPYLLQHARNPVDWYPWGDEAFEVARKEDKPIFLSIGYSTCHWCHVMEHESFEDPEVAALMNEHFVCIKVDREERPDLDHLYMQVTQAMSGNGGWPMTVVMTADKIPFFTGTYFPKDGRFGRPGMLQLVPKLSDVWKTNRESVEKSTTEVMEYMRRTSVGNPGEDLGPEVLDLAYELLRGRFDGERGGFGKAPKFPVPHNLLFLLQYYERSGKEQALSMVEKTLREMRRGGVYDHVGFGFHRYSTDAEWLLPHFEKMLYDQALLALAYTAAAQVTGEEEYERTAREILTYVQRDMTAPEGGFYSAEDADSEGEEGLFYLWTVGEVKAVLGDEDGNFFANVFNLRSDGNFHDEASGASTGRNIPHLRAELADIAKQHKLEVPELNEKIESCRQRLFEVREVRIHPLKDDKILTDWNGLMIAAFSRAAQAFGDPTYAETARRAADFVLAELRTEDDRLLKRYRQGHAGLPGTLEDYAFFVWGLIELYETVFDVRYLEAALALTEAMQKHFGDPEGGGFFISADDTSDLIVRSKEAYDGAIPSGTSVASWNLLRLARITGRAELEELAAAALRSFSRTVKRNPAAHTQMLAAVDFGLGPSYEIVIAGSPEAEDTRAMLDAFWKRYLPHKVLLLRPPGEAPPIVALAPFTAEQRAGERATAFVCRDFACKAPTSDPAEALLLLDPEAWEE